jgi:formylmethanofuran dehydrogenase subunit D
VLILLEKSEFLFLLHRFIDLLMQSITISAVSLYDDVEHDFADFPHDLPDDPEGALELDYALALVSPALFSQLFPRPEEDPHLRIRTFYGEVVVHAEKEEGLSPKVVILPLSPYVYLLQPATHDTDTLPQEREDDLDAAIESGEASMENEEKEDHLPDTPLDYQTVQTFRAEIEPCSIPVTSLKQMRELFLQKSRPQSQ